MYPYTYVPWKVFIKSCCENVKHVPKLCKSGRSSCYSTLLKRFFILFFILFTAHLGLGFYYIIYTVLQWDLPPLRPPLWGGHPRQRFEPGTGDLEDGTAHLEKYYKYCIKWCFLKLFSSQKLRFFLASGVGFPHCPKIFYIIHYAPAAHQYIIVGDAGFKPRTSAPDSNPGPMSHHISKLPLQIMEKFWFQRWCTVCNATLQLPVLRQHF